MLTGALALASGCQPTAEIGNPSTPITVTQLGRTLTIDLVNLTSPPSSSVVLGGSTVAVTSPGESVRLLVEGAWTNGGEECPTCVTQFYARMNGVFSLCLGSAVDGLSFRGLGESVEFNAPSEPGEYVINVASTWEFDCLDDSTADEGFGEGSLAVLIVE